MEEAFEEVFCFEVSALRGIGQRPGSFLADL